MIDRARMEAIFQTLRTSIESGLNASLTPDDCRELLRMFALQRMSATIQQSPPAPSPAPRKTPVEQIVEGVAGLAHGVIEDLAGDFGGIPARKRRR